MNFFTADVQTGFGAFVSLYLAQLQWSQDRMPEWMRKALSIPAPALAGPEHIRTSSIDQATHRAGGKWNWRYRLVCWSSYSC